MPVETRRITFTDDELIVAAIEYCREARIAVPEADVERIQLGTDPDRLVTLTFAVRSPVEADQIVLSTQQLITALDRFCRRIEISIPAGPEKIICCENGALAMLYESPCRKRLRRGHAA